MKTFKNPFRALVELRSVGNNVVAAKVSTSMRLCALDLKNLSVHILRSLLPSDVGFLYLYDGTFILFSFHSGELSELCVPSQDRDLESLDTELELDDGLVYAVHITLSQTDDVRRDYHFAQTRCLCLVGEVCINVNDGLSDGDMCEA